MKSHQLFLLHFPLLLRDLNFALLCIDSFNKNIPRIIETLAEIETAAVITDEPCHALNSFFEANLMASVEERGGHVPEGQPEPNYDAEADVCLSLPFPEAS